RHFKAILSGAFFMLVSVSLFAADKPPVRLEESFLKEIRILIYILIFIALLIGYIATVLSVKDVGHLSIKYIWDGIVGRNAPDPETNHDYDGIRELDNPMPAWLRFIFIGSIIFAVVYLVHYHVLKTGSLSKEEYDVEMATAAETYKSVELPEDQLIMVTDGGRLAAAEAVFVENCATCHRKDLGGESGPNLTDEYWIHGNDVKAIYNTITNGVAGKSMISWKDRIPSQERLAIASFILSKQGSNPANPRAPEGQVAGAEAPTVAVDSAANDTTVPVPQQ
ncbi:MAG TPA: cbb3-type cytochrome c oxidase N-terminal domain-containing protein, partial [Bacteroidia bacterium]|nr:cbb3-type cytochrome c oxidase N-terminal domain-containing protein [Bacteroidia bacterium]